MEDRIPKRSEVAVENTWRLEDIFTSDDKWSEEYSKVKKLPEKIASFKGTLANDNGKRLLEYLEFSDELSLRLEALGNYAMRRSDEDQANGFYLDMCGKIMALYSEIGSAGAFASPEIVAIEESALEAFYKAEPSLELYRRALTKERLMKEHILSDAEERILAFSSQMARSSEDIYSAFMNADIKFPSVKDKDGKEHILTQGTYIKLLSSEDRILRKNAFEAFYDVFGDHKNTVAATFNGQMIQLKFYADLRKFDSTIEASLASTEVPVNVYHNLIDTVHNNMDKMYKYIRLRKKLMKVDELHMYDIYCPIINGVDKKIPYEEAKANVLDALSVLGDEYISVLKKGFTDRWIDVYENEGKRTGAYQAGGRPHPYVLLNHKDNIDSEFTIAHEMGHALHTYYSIKNQPTVYSDYVIFVAEVASTCNEVLLMRYLIDHTDDKKEKAYLINHFLEQFRTTLYRQTMFAEFELDINTMVENNETLTADVLSDRYYELNKLYFGEDIVVDDRIKLEWSRIPHFFYDYYVFQYATGFAAAVALANRILNEGEPAVKDYINFLSGGCSTDPISLLKIAGVDMGSPAPVNEALEVFDGLIDELEALAEE